MKKTTRILALALVFVTLFCTLCIGASAANYKNKSKTFVIRSSDGYTEIGEMCMKSTSTDGKKGTITISSWNSDAPLTISCAYPSGTTFNYTISTMKEGKSITLTSSAGSLYGKIHISGDKSWNNIWKIDTLKTNNFGLFKAGSAGFYFRNS